LPVGTNTISTPVELKWSGASGPTLGANQSLTSDPVVGLGYTTGQSLVVVCDSNSSGQKLSTTATGWSAVAAACSTLAGVSWNVANVASFCGTPNTNFAVNVTSIQTQAGGGAAHCQSRLLMGVGC
jgi:hypothetical protein